MSHIFQALEMIGMSRSDYEQEGFNRKAGRKAAAVLRGMGYRKFKVTWCGGGREEFWGKKGGRDQISASMPAFNCLVAALADASRC